MCWQRVARICATLVDGNNICPTVCVLGECKLGSTAPLRNSRMHANVAT
jgi:hypothetical protein